MSAHLLPNLIILGTQTAGTAWLHSCLQDLDTVSDGSVRNAGIFNAENIFERLPDYASAFPSEDKPRWRLETAANYFRLPEKGLDVAARLRDILGSDIKLMVILRNPLERYHSLCVRQMAEGHIPYTPVMSEITTESDLLAGGDYASILTHWQAIFDHIGIFFFDDLQQNPHAFLKRVTAHAGLPNTTSLDKVHRPVNTISQVIERSPETQDWPTVPTLCPGLKRQLAVYYRAEIRALSRMTDRDLSHWSL